MFPIMAGNSASTGYNLTRSLRFRASASATLSRTPSVAATSNKTFTVSFWMKPSLFVSTSYIWILDSGSQDFGFYLNASYTASFQMSGGANYITTSQVFRDPAAWYHMVIAVDTTQATAANRLKFYVNGSQVTAFSSASYPAQNTTFAWNQSGQAQYFGRNSANSAFLYDGYLAEFYSIDGQALTPSSFGSTNALTGVWQPARYTGTYGTNGFYLPFTDNSALTTSSNVGLGKDFSGNGNYWTTNNISITAGVTYDSMTDVPTLTSATAANFAVLNPVNKATVMPAPTNGNLYITGSSGGYWNAGLQSSIGVSSGKWYWEVSAIALSISNGYFAFGIASNYFQPTTITANDISYLPGVASNTGGYWRPQISATYFNGTTGSFSGSFAVGDVCNIAFDADTGKIWYGKNGTWLNSGNPSTGANPAFTVTTGNAPYYPWIGMYATTDTWAMNFGQRPFSYTPPTGFVALNTFNLPTSTILQGNKVMDATLYTGTGASLSVTNAASFKPDLVWVKGRSGATDHALYDSVRGTTKQLESNTTTAETTEATGLTAFGSAGFTVGALAQMNTSAATYVGWQWQAGQGSSSSNTNGTITSTVSVNASAGFSVVTYTGTGANATVGHGLGVAPAFYVVKARNYGSGGNWVAWHTSIGQPNALWMNLTNAQFSYPTAFNSTNPTSSVLSLGTAPEVNNSGSNFVAYCWTPIAGYSAFGSLTGNGSADGPFVYLGFRPRFILYKRTDSTSNWRIWDTARTPYNAMSSVLYPDASDAEYTATTQDFDALSNGFKIRNSSAAMNASGGTYIYAAFASNPFRNSLAQ